MNRPAPRRTGEAGIFRGCCLGLVLLVAIIAFVAYCTDRAIAAPDLGAPPAGPDDGSGEVQIAIAMAAQLAPQLLSGPHGRVTLSEHDLTVLAQTHNPHPDRYTNLTVRVRDHLVVISADDHFGPLKVTPVLHVALDLGGSNATEIDLRVRALDVGQLPLPGYIRDHFAGELPAVVSIPSLFNANPLLRAASTNIECVTVAQNGIVIGVHRPGASADATRCDASS